MKKLLTLIMPDIAPEEVENAPEETEILNYGNEVRLYDAIKRAKGKYVIIADGDAECALDDTFFKTLENSSADILKLNGCFAFKTSVAKSVPQKNCTNKFTAETFCALCAKSVERLSGPSPVVFKKNCQETDFEAAKSEITTSVEEFKRCKSKLVKDVYAVAAEIICARLVPLYVRALLDIRAKKLDSEEFLQFDAYLKENVVLYIALEKRFAFADLKKLRKNAFKINYFTYLKLKKAL